MRRVKNIHNKNPFELQRKIAEWIEKGGDISVESINIWYDAANNVNLCTILYTDRSYQ